MSAACRSRGLPCGRESVRAGDGLPDLTIFRLHGLFSLDARPLPQLTSAIDAGPDYQPCASFYAHARGPDNSWSNSTLARPADGRRSGCAGIREFVLVRDRLPACRRRSPIDSSRSSSIYSRCGYPAEARGSRRGNRGKYATAVSRVLKSGIAKFGKLIKATGIKAVAGS